MLNISAIVTRNKDTNETERGRVRDQGGEKEDREEGEGREYDDREEREEGEMREERDEIRKR